MLKRIKYMECRGLLRDSSMDGTWIELSCTFRISPPGDETRHGWRWDAIIKTWVEVRHDVDGGGCNNKKLNGGEPGHGWRWDAHPETWMGLRWGMAGIEMQQDGVEGRLGWIWNANHGTWMGVRRDLDGVQALISKRGLVWDRTWMELWCKYHDLNGGDVTWIQMRHETSDLDGGETVHGLGVK